MTPASPPFDLLCILGSTATGKTRLAATLSARVGGEVLSADSRQVYRGMDIGTGKDLEEYLVDGHAVPYHLVDIAEPGTEYNLFQYQKDFLKAYEGVKARGRLPILCGGSGMYLEAALSGYELSEVREDEELRAELAPLTDEELVKRLAALRPLHATTDTEDRERLVRAIEIAVHSAGPAPAGLPELDARVFGIRWERKAQRKRITERLRQRLDTGMVDEVRRLLDEGVPAEQLVRYGLEYRFLTQYVLGELNRNDMFQKLNSAIHKFAKRQDTWFRRMERRGIRIEWLDGGLPLEEKVEQILDRTGLTAAAGREG